MRRLSAIGMLSGAIIAIGLTSSPALATPAPCSFGGVVEAFPDAHPDKGCQVHLVVQRGDLVDKGLELSVSPTPQLDFNQIQLKSSDGVYSFTVQELPQLSANFSTRRTDCDCAPEYGGYVFDHYLLIPDQRLPSSTTIEVQGLPSSAQLPEYTSGWELTTTAATQGANCSQLSSLQAGQGPLCGTCDVCFSDDMGVAADSGTGSGAAGADQGPLDDDQGIARGDHTASSLSESSGCAVASGSTPFPFSLLLLLLLGTRRVVHSGGARS